MKIGIFDSGVGGLIMTKSFIEGLPEYDYLYLGDTKRVPYGDRSQEAIFQFTKDGVVYLFEKGCQLIILACNTASAEALRRLQQDYLPNKYPDRRILGVLIPAAEAALEGVSMPYKVGVLATVSTVASGAYLRELCKIQSDVEVCQQAAPMLVPLIENNTIEKAEPFLHEYLDPLIKEEIEALILGCTHYSLLKEQIRAIVGDDVKVISQDEIVYSKLANYLVRHPEIESKLGKNGKH